MQRYGTGEVGPLRVHPDHLRPPVLLFFHREDDRGGRRGTVGSEAEDRGEKLEPLFRPRRDLVHRRIGAGNGDEEPDRVLILILPWRDGRCRRLVERREREY